MYNAHSVSARALVLLSSLAFLVLDVNSTDLSTRIDFDGDGKTDISVYRPGEVSPGILGKSYFYYRSSLTGEYHVFQWGLGLDIPAPADYDGDLLTDFGVFRWWQEEYPYNVSDHWIAGSQGDTMIVHYPAYGLLQNANYAGGLGAELAAWRAVDVDPEPYPNDCWIPGFFVYTGYQSIRKNVIDQCLDGTITIYPAVGDYNGDGRSELAAFFRHEGDFTAYFRVWNSLTPLYSWPDKIQYLDVDIPIPGDYDGDGKTNFAGAKIDAGSLLWRYWDSSSEAVREVKWGFIDDVPVPGDYDGDGKTDIAVFRPSNSVWYIRNSLDNSVSYYLYGLPSDMPLTRPSSFYQRPAGVPTLGQR